jgi:hypothetical protein
LRIENRNVYWLDDECKRLKAELETAVLRWGYVVFRFLLLAVLYNSL